MGRLSCCDTGKRLLKECVLLKMLRRINLRIVLDANTKIYTTQRAVWTRSMNARMALTEGLEG